MRMRKAVAFATILVMTAALMGCTKKNDSGTPISSVSSISSISSDTSSVSATASDGTSASISISDSISTSTTSSDSSSTSTSTSTGTSVSEPEENETLDIAIRIINECGVGVAMVAAKDPISGQVVPIGELAANAYLELTIAWPAAETDFVFYLINTAGEVVANSTVDITGVKESVTIRLTGDQKLDRVNAEVN